MNNRTRYAIDVIVHNLSVLLFLYMICAMPHTMRPFLQILYLKNVHACPQICQETKSDIANTEWCFHDLYYYIFSLFSAERQCFKDCNDMKTLM